jgi:hypothetical protein
MTKQQSLIITPPPELVQQWIQQSTTAECTASQVATLAAQWGADQELEACCEWLGCGWKDIELVDKLRSARRPKPPSLKEQAIAVLEDAEMDAAHYNILLRALEQLDD